MTDGSLTTDSGTIDLGLSATEGHPTFVARDPDNRDAPYSLELVLRLGGYGTRNQAIQTAERIRRMLSVALSRNVELTDTTVTRT